MSIQVTVHNLNVLYLLIHLNVLSFARVAMGAPLWRGDETHQWPPHLAHIAANNDVDSKMR